MGQAIKSLAKDTAIYGVSSIVGRFLNWCLVPMYTHLFTKSEYGVVTYIYSITALLLIILTYGMETGFFRFTNHEKWNNPGKVYTTSLLSIFSTSAIFVLAVLAFAQPLSEIMECNGHADYIVLMAAAVAMDAVTAIPFAYLRYKKRPIRFATLKLINIGLNIGLNVVFLVLCPWIMKTFPGAIDSIYSPNYGIGYIFLSNFIASAVTLFMLYPELKAKKYSFDGKLLKEMLSYSFPLLILGIAGIMNQSIDKIIYPLLTSDPENAMSDIGVYGANYKIAIVMVMFIQAFRFAYEPFIFAQNKEAGKDKMQAYCDAMKYFVIFGLLIFLGVMFFIDIIKYFVAPEYFVGLKVVPIIMIAELFFGIFFNLSLWYKLTDKTIWGTWFSLLGLAVTLVLNAILVPFFGYMGCAWAALGCYTTMMVVSYFVGKAKYPIDYDIRTIGLYFGIAIILYVASIFIKTGNKAIDFPVRLLMLAAYVFLVIRKEKPTLNIFKRKK
ncbi:MAG: lipopolysaccharide biosynthesis protein [Muribaculaceae bacterium]